jgi:hypothetical protein
MTNKEYILVLIDLYKKMEADNKIAKERYDKELKRLKEENTDPNRIYFYPDYRYFTQQIYSDSMMYEVLKIVNKLKRK